MPNDERDSSATRLECLRLAADGATNNCADCETTKLLVWRAKAFFEFATTGTMSDELAEIRAEIDSVARAIKVIALGPVDPSVRDFGFPASLEVRLKSSG